MPSMKLIISRHQPTYLLTPHCAPTKVSFAARYYPIDVDKFSDDTFLLVVYTAERQIRLYRISLDWQQSVGKEVPPHAVFNHLETVEDLGPTTDSIDTQSSAFTAPSAFAQLSHLELVPSGVGTRDMETPLPTILAVFSYVPSQYHDTDLQDSGVFSILSRWEFCATKPDLHPCFDQLPSKRINTPTSNNSKVSTDIPLLDLSITKP